MDEVKRLKAEVAELQKLSDEQHMTLGKLSGLLRRTANALKGKPTELSSHDWSDLPEVIAAMKAERDRLSLGVEKLTDKRREANEQVRHQREYGGESDITKELQIRARTLREAEEIFKTLKKIPAGMSQEEEAKFWETHDTSEYELGEEVDVVVEKEAAKPSSD